METLYNKYKDIFEKSLKETKTKISQKIKKQKNFKILIKHAENNLFSQKKKPSLKECEDAAIKYIIYKVAEDEALIYRDFSNCVKSAFSYPAMGHGKYLTHQAIPPLESCISLYTSSKGVKAQPWQGIGKKEKNNRIIILTKNNLKKYA